MGAIDPGRAFAPLPLRVRKPGTTRFGVEKRSG